MTGIIAADGGSHANPGRIGCLVAALASTSIAAARDGFDGSEAGEWRAIAGVKLSWCPLQLG